MDDNTESKIESVCLNCPTHCKRDIAKTSSMILASVMCVYLLYQHIEFANRGVPLELPWFFYAIAICPFFGDQVQKLLVAMAANNK